MMRHREGPATIPIQPQPINVQIIHQRRDGRPETIIAREWRLQDARVCQLCQQCSATTSDTGNTALCLKQVTGQLSCDEAALFRDPTRRHILGDERPGSVAG